MLEIRLYSTGYILIFQAKEYGSIEISQNIKSVIY